MKIFKNKKWKSILLTAILAVNVFASFVPVASADVWGWLKDNTGSSDDKTSFTDFKGGLSAPSTDGYSPSMTQSTDIRTFILNVTNFFLGFLGLIAVVIIIYGGFMYVTDMGKGESQKKGKQAISYALTGLIIVLASYALVNTILAAGGGKMRGSAEVGVGKTVKYSIYANRVKTIAENIVTAYRAQAERNSNLNGFNTTYSTAYNYINSNCAHGSPDDCGKRLGDGVENTFNNFKTQLDSSIALLNVIKGKLSDSLMDTAAKSKIDDINNYLNAKYVAAYNKAISTAHEKNCDANLNLFSNICGAGGARQIYEDFLATMEFTGSADLANPPVWKKSSSDDCKSLQNANQMLCNLNILLLNSFSSTVDTSAEELSDIRESVSDVIPDSTKQFLSGLIGLAPNHYMGQLKELKENVSIETGDMLNNTSNSFQKLTDVTNSLKSLYDALIDLEGVNVKLTADVTSGSAPLPVTFSVVGSTDPSGNTIADSVIRWSLKSDKTGERYSDCETTTGTIAKCTYLKPGTYQVKVTIDSSDNSKYAKGIATMIVNVAAPKTKINACVSTDKDGKCSENKSGQSTTKNIITYDKNGQLIQDVDSLTMSALSAKNGLYFNALDTKASTGEKLSNQASSGATITWDFGDGSTGSKSVAAQPSTESNLLVPHTYKTAGNYNVKMTFKDKDGVVDRKFFTLALSDTVANINVSNNKVKVGEPVKFDASDSTNDDNKNLTYEWSCVPDACDSLMTDNKNKEKFEYSFSKPGIYTVTLKVSTIGDTPSTSTEKTITVYSDPPVARFTYSQTSKNDPRIFVFDGKRSFDPDNTDKNQKLNYSWTVNGKDIDGTDVSFVGNKPDSTSPKATLKFNKLGTYQVGLIVSDPNGDGDGKKQDSELNEQDVVVDNILDLDVQGTLTGSIPKTGDTQQPVVFTIKSDNATAYEVDFGDGEKDQGIKTKSTDASVKHIYKTAGTFVAKISVFDDTNKDTTISKKVYITSSSDPSAILTVKVNGEETADVSDLTVGRDDVLVFDATKSKNVDGTGRRLQYSWDLGNGALSSKDQISTSYKDIGDYKVSLKVVNTNDVQQSATDTINVHVKALPPTLRSINVVPVSSSLTTPVVVKVTAVGAEDPDGKIINYRWWYYDTKDTSQELGVQVSQDSSATLTLGTKGDEGKDVTYQFAVEMTDNENTKVLSTDILKNDKNGIPSLTVTNGPNKAPVSKFDVDRTSINVGESVEFTSSSTDPDGSIKAYYWDFEGDGFANNTTDEGPHVTHTFTKAAKDGIKIRLKVVDNNDSETVSDPIVIYVEGKSQPPVAAFTSQQTGTTKTVKFTNNSTVDTANGASIKNYSWDFDTTVDSNGDGKKDNDIDSTDQSPTYEYPDYGIYRAKLSIEDSEGNKSNISNFVNVKAPAQTVELKQKPVAAFVGVQASDTKKLLVTNNSKAADGATISKYEWDFDVNTDSDGDGKKDNDVQSTDKIPTIEYPDYGTYKAKLTVTDNNNQVSSVTNEVTLKKPAASSIIPGATNNTGNTQVVEKSLDARLLSDPTTNQKDGRIHLSGDHGTVTFDFSQSTGDIKKFIIDKNIYYDSNGNGNAGDDEDFVSLTPGKWQTDFSKSYGAITVRLTIIGNEGKKDTVEKSIVFDSPKGSSNSNTNSLGTLGSVSVLSDAKPNDYIAILFGIVAVLLGGVIITTTRELNKKHKK